MLQKLGKNKEDSADGPTSAKLRKMESNSKNTSHNSNSPKQLIKDLRVKVERLSTDGNIETQANDETDNKEDALKTNDKDEESQVPCLPVAEDEPTREITSTCPQGLKKEGSQEDMVTSSSQEPRSKCVLVQTEQVQTETLPAKVNFQLDVPIIHQGNISQPLLNNCKFADQTRTQNFGTTNGNNNDT